jgi:hypothetical protein
MIGSGGLRDKVYYRVDLTGPVALLPAATGMWSAKIAGAMRVLVKARLLARSPHQAHDLHFGHAILDRETCHARLDVEASRASGARVDH